GEAHAGRIDGRDARLHVARANSGATHRPAHRYFFGGHHPVPVLDRPEAVYGGGRLDGREEDHPGRSPDAVVDQRGAVGGVRPGGGQGAGEESRPALCDRARIRARAQARRGRQARDTGGRTHRRGRARAPRPARPEAEERAGPAIDKTIKLADAPSPEPARAEKRRSLLVPAVLGVLVAAGAVTYFVVMKPSQQSTTQKLEAEARARRDAAEAAK